MHCLSFLQTITHRRQWCFIAAWPYQYFSPLSSYKSPISIARVSISCMKPMTINVRKRLFCIWLKICSMHRTHLTKRAYWMNYGNISTECARQDTWARRTLMPVNICSILFNITKRPWPMSRPVNLTAYKNDSSAMGSSGVKMPADDEPTKKRRTRQHLFRVWGRLSFVTNSKK